MTEPAPTTSTMEDIQAKLADFGSMAMDFGGVLMGYASIGLEHLWYWTQFGLDLVASYAIFLVALYVLAISAKKIYTWAMTLRVSGKANEWVVIMNNG